MALWCYFPVAERFPGNNSHDLYWYGFGAVSRFYMHRRICVGAEQRAIEEGVDEAFAYIASTIGVDRVATRDSMRSAGRYHVETW